ncbi:TPA: adenosine deaminase [Campylobacter lari]|uniref:adenine-specific methyltransferase EcoRI family protein n=1 Tax=Campylobacter sp. W0066.2 TaxID=2735752 RepID=UPI0029840C8F|nr:adenine-specific methyltransferase EcoRI family protein [Campylobacter sp. W0066.2]HEG2582166.1 adenosine deaminase [Campylobacter lari]
MNKNSSTKLNNAKNIKNDEFYTQYEDIKKELSFYESAFKDKIVYCNCDDPQKSNFTKFFELNFDRLNLKKIISTSFNADGKGKIFIMEKDKPKYQGFLENNGDFRSDETIKLLKESDIVVTNPPFSLFREFIDMLISNQKDFLVIGNSNAISYKNCFNYMMKNKLWLGQNCVRWFINTKGELVEGARSFWFSNINNQKRNKKISLNRKYNKQYYTTYDNYNAIEISKTKDIPLDYTGIMGVPITFLDKYNPQQFEIIGADYQVKSGELVCIKRNDWNGKTDRAYINGKRLYSRIFIKHKEVDNVI